jgi:hypothetical protein
MLTYETPALATIDDRNLIFGPKLHIGMPYCGKRFWTRQIPTSCLPKSRGIISEHLLTVHLVCVWSVVLDIIIQCNFSIRRKQEVGIWWVQKRFPRYGVHIWSLWPNIRSQPSIVAEKNVTKNVHICSMCHLYMHIFRHIFLSNYWWQESDIWSQASYMYVIL